MNDNKHGDWQATARLLERYDSPGPRYTSYPTAVEFHEGIDAAAYAERLAGAAAHPDEPLSIYVHLPFCEERCLFCGCHVIITPHKDRARPYLELLKKEIDMVAAALGERRSVSQLHLGGGTPTYHEPDELRELLSHLLGAFRPTADAELAVEVDPRVTRVEHLDVLAAFGFNRLSMGVQDFTPQVQQAIGRVQSEEATRTLVEAARARGFRGINIDLIYGLPHQQPESFARTVEAVIAMQADRCAVYSFAFVPWIRGHQKKLIEDDLPSRETKFSLFALAREHFLAAGYRAIGMDHFARPDDELAIAREEGRLRRNFQGYTVIPASDVIGLGISAIGDVGGLHVQNEKKLSRYQAAIDAGRLPVERGVARNEDDEIRREVIHDLMCNGRVDFAAVEQRFGIRFTEYFAQDLDELKEHAETGMVTIGTDAIEATPLGELFIRNLARCFDRYWREKHADGESPVFSRTV